MVKANFSVVIENKPVAYAGSGIRGHVWAEVQQEMKGSSLSVDFYGKEKTCVKYTTRTSNGKTTTTRTHYAHGERNLIQVSLPIDQLRLIQSGRIQPGRYVLPFQFSLPSNLPSSFVYSTVREYAKIQYKIKATLKGSGWIKNYECESYVPISSCPPIEPVPFQGQPSTSMVNACCWNRGSMTLGAHMDTTIIGKGQKANVSFACRNNSTAKVEYVRACLKQRISWQASGHTKRCSKVLCEVRFPTIGIGLDAVSKEAKDRQRSFDSVRNENLSILDELRTGRTVRKVSLPRGAVSSYMGSIIQVSHDLKLEVKTGSCIDNPTVRIPIFCCDIPMLQQTESTTTQSGQPNVAPSAPIEPLGHPAPPSNPEIVHNGTNNDPEIVYAEPVSVGASHAVMGGAASLGTSGVGEAEIQVPPMVGVTSLDTPDLDTLLREMRNSVGEISFVGLLLNEPAWQSFFAFLTPAQYGLVVSSVQSSFDETGMAVLLAQSVQSFTCAYVAKAIQKASDFSRTNLVEKLLPYCIDLATNHKQIELVLTEWEQSVTKRAFDKELERREC